MDEQEAAEHNATAWLMLTDRELIERSASLDLPAELVVDASDAPDGVVATADDVTTLRANADAEARGLAGDAFVDGWIAANRSG